MNRIITYFILILFVSVNAFSQQSTNREISNIISTADIEFEKRNYYGAAKLYEKALEYNSRMYDIVWKAAEGYRLDNDYLRAAHFYKILIDNALNSYPKAMFYMGEMEKFNEEYIRAQYYFNRYYQDNKEDETNLLVIRAKKELEYCEYAWKLLKNPTGVVVETFDTVINTVFSEFSPTLLRDSILFFSSIRSTDDNTTKDYRSKIYYSLIINDTVFTEEKELDSVINMPGYDVANPFITQDGKILYFSAMKANYQSESHIYKSYYNFEENKWSEPELLPEKINIKGYNSIHPSFAERENNTDIFLWSSNRSGGEGGYDMWYCEVLPDGSYGLVRNVGRPILQDSRFIEFYDTTSVVNTIGNEISPFYNPKDSLLYFSSDWLKGMGGYDIFSMKGDFKTWDSLKNLGYPINTAQNDFYFKIFEDAGYALLASNRKGSPAVKHQSCCNALYYYKLDKEIDEEAIEEQRIELLTEQTKLLVPIELYFHNDRPVPRSWDTVTSINYKDSYYDYIALLDEYREEFSKGLRRRDREEAIDSINSFFADYVEANFNKLLEFTELIKELLKEGKVIEITIKGFTSPLTVAEYNINLSKRRISSLVNFFYEHDDGYFLDYIDEGQIIFDFIAFGETLARPDVSADPDDPRSSIYSPAASVERRIEIIAVSVEDNIYEDILFEKVLFEDNLSEDDILEYNLMEEELLEDILLEDNILLTPDNDE